MSLVKLRDTYGLPADIIWCKLRDEGHPIAAELTSEQFERELVEFAKTRQAVRHVDWPINVVKKLIIEVGG